MSNSGLIGASAPGNVAQVSPSVWADSPNTLLNDRGLGYFIHQDFLGDYGNSATVTPASLQSDADTGSTFLNASSATWGPNVLAMLDTNTDNNATAVFTTEFGQIVRNSGRPLWFEARYAVGALGDSGFFLGLTTLAGATRDLIADNPSNSAVAARAAVSTIGFASVQASSALATVNAVYSKATATPVTVLADVTNASALTAYEATLPVGGQITQAQGVTAQATAPIGDGIWITHGNLVANAFRKYAIRFDGKKTMYFYVDGVVVARQEVDSTFDQTSYYVGVVCQKTGAATQIINYLDFLRLGFQLRS